MPFPVLYATLVASLIGASNSQVLDYRDNITALKPRELNRTAEVGEGGIISILNVTDSKSEINVSVLENASSKDSKNNFTSLHLKEVQSIIEDKLKINSTAGSDNTLLVPKFGFIKLNNDTGMILDHNNFRHNLSEALGPVLKNKTDSMTAAINLALNNTDSNIESEGYDISKLKAALNGFPSEVLAKAPPGLKRKLDEIFKSQPSSERFKDIQKTIKGGLDTSDVNSEAPKDLVGRYFSDMRTEVKGYNTYMGNEMRSEDPVQIVEESPAYASSVVLASDILSLSSAVSEVKNKLCREQGHRFLDGLLYNKRWALKMFDASAKSPQGLLFGSSYHLGNFDECVAVREESLPTVPPPPPLLGKYCLATIKWPQSEAVRKQRSGRGGELRWAVCVPDACDAGDVRQFVLDVLARTVGNTSVIVHDADCYRRNAPTVDTIDRVVLCLISFFVLMIAICTSLDVWWARQCNKRRSILQDLVVSFSASHNLSKLLSTKQPKGTGLDCIAGIKSLAMVFITAGHACLFIASGPVMDADAWDRLLRHPMNSFMLNNTLLVDTFLMLSAFLFCNLLLLELDKRRGKINVLIIYVFRYIRVTPAYLVVILFYMTWFSKIGEGPLWKDKIELEQERCSANWWANILYINNYVNTGALCMFQSWYLSVDTQLFFLAPAFIYPLWRWRRVGPAILSLGTVISALIPAVVTYEDNLDPTLMVYAKEFKDITQNKYFKEAYIKTHMKLTPYFMGLWFGYILHRVQTNNYKFSTRLKAIAWTLSVILGTSVVFSVSLFYQEWFHYSGLDSVSYAGLHKLGWGLANGWLILACSTGNGGILGSLLTWKFLVPISRLTFCAYLVNGIIELYYIGTVRHPLHISFFSVFEIAVSHIVLTFLLALVLCLVFESPLHGIEKVLLKKYASPRDNSRTDVNEEESSTRSSTSQLKVDA